MTDALPTATSALLATVDALPDDAWSAPTHCHGWDRAHVIAHLALNAEALAGVLRGLAERTSRPMYASDADRDADIDRLAGEPPERIRTRLRASAAEFAAAQAAAGQIAGDITFDRTPGGQVLPARAIPRLRLSEVEVHHADLAVGYTSSDWPADTAALVLATSARRHRGTGFRAVASDDHRDWTFGETGPDSPTVSGPIGALAWWSTGRDPGPVLSSTNGTLPTMEGR